MYNHLYSAAVLLLYKCPLKRDLYKYLYSTAAHFAVQTGTARMNQSRSSIYYLLKTPLNRDNIVRHVQMSAVGGIVLPQNLDER